jgi:hypothetical protein
LQDAATQLGGSCRKEFLQERIECASCSLASIHANRSSPRRTTETSAFVGAAAGGESGARGEDVRFSIFSYESLSNATKNFEKLLGGGGCGSVFHGVLVSGTRVAVKRLELGVAADAGAAGLSMQIKCVHRWRCCRKCNTSTLCRCWDRARTAWRPA